MEDIVHKYGSSMVLYDIAWLSMTQYVVLRCSFSQKILIDSMTQASDIENTMSCLFWNARCQAGSIFDPEPMLHLTLTPAYR